MRFTAVEWLLLAACALMIATVAFAELTKHRWCWSIDPPRALHPGVVYGLGKLETASGVCMRFEFVPVFDSR